MEANGHRVVLSGIGGDEVLGGVPTAIPELADLLVPASCSSIHASSGCWAVATRRPAVHLLSQTVSGFLPPTVPGRNRPCHAP